MNVPKNNNLLLWLLIAALLCTVSCAKKFSPPPATAKETPAIAESKKTSPMEEYIYNVMNAVRQNWAFTMRLSEPTTCSVDVDISPAGEILSYKLTKSSGNKYYDNSALNAVARTKKEGALPTPPEPLSKGVTIVFSLPAGR